jgi:hypothetical protein
MKYSEQVNKSVKAKHRVEVIVNKKFDVCKDNANYSIIGNNVTVKCIHY